MKKQLAGFLLSIFVLFLLMPGAEAAANGTTGKDKILFVPHDNRPISDVQTADTIRKLGYEVIVPPDDLLGDRSNLGNPDALWQWTESHAKDVKAAVFSSDSMLYGSLVGSRKHNYTKQQILTRAAKFEEFRKKNPKVKLYVFGSIMRTPRSGAASGSEEPGYYAQYGSDIFRYTALSDKKEMEGLNHREKKEYDFLARLIPPAAMQDWLDRRQKNFLGSQYMIGLTRKGTFDYFVLGRDDNAPYSQTHMESRKLAEMGKDLGNSRFQAMAGIDEVALLMLTRAVNDLTKTVPFIEVRYNWGAGPNTIPSYSDESIDKSIRSHVIAAGGMMVSSSKRADFVLLVNTNPSGKTYEANFPENNGVPREGTRYFADMVSESIAAGEPAGVGDVAFANGADNALMEELKNRGLLFKLRAYGGWNTATNSTGFVLAQGMLSAKMTNDARDQLLLQRYLDDWAYQSNIRQVIGRQLGWLRGSGAYASLDNKRLAVEGRATRMMHQFADENLPPFTELRDFTVTFPWNRMFEANIDLHPSNPYQEYFGQ